MDYKKILIIHDRFMFRGGAERLVLDMARGLNADIATGFWADTDTYPKSDVPYKLFVLDNPSQKAGFRYVKFQILFYFKTKFIKDYDVVIFSGNNCLSAAHNVRKGIPKIFYSHSPVRHAYDLKDHYLSRMSFLKRMIFRVLIQGSRMVYELGVKQMDVVVTNSQNTKERFKKYMNMEVRAIYPPIQTNKFTWLGQKNYYMTVGRVDKLKRIPDIVKAFAQIPDKKLVIPSGGDDLENIKNLAKGHDNIQVLGWVSDDQLRGLIGNCIATFYIPINEDAGMAQLEGMAAGKPCISVNEGGIKESVIDGKTGFLIPSEYTIDDIISTVYEMTPETALSMKDDCISMASKFSYEKFIMEIGRVIEETRLISGIKR